jgi:hypothetical protein
MPTGFILLVAAVLAGIAYGSWYYMTLNGRDAGDLVAQLPRKIADLVGMDRSSGETPTPSAAEAPMARVESRAAVPVPAPARPAEPAAEAPARTAEPAAPEPEAKPPESVAETTLPAADTARSAASPPEPQSRPTPPAPDRESASPPQSAVVTVPLPADAEAGDTAVRPAAIVETVPSAGGDALSPATAPAAEADSAAPPAEGPAASPPEPSGQVAAIPPAAPATPPEEASGRVVLRATAISWVELRDSEGKRIFSRLLKKGETYNVPAKTGITLATGNAGALDILVDGRAISPIGPPGAVRRDVLLEPDALLGRGAPGQ